MLNKYNEPPSTESPGLGLRVFRGFIGHVGFAGLFRFIGFTGFMGFMGVMGRTNMLQLCFELRIEYVPAFPDAVRIMQLT